MFLSFIFEECSIESEKKVNILAIVLGTIAGIVLIGLLLLIIWKLIVTGHVSPPLIGSFCYKLHFDWFFYFQFVFWLVLFVSSCFFHYSFLTHFCYFLIGWFSIYEDCSMSLFFFREILKNDIILFILSGVKPRDLKFRKY